MRVALFLVVLGVPGAALAQRAEYVQPDALEPEPWSHHAGVTTLGHWAHVVDREEANALDDVITFAMRARMVIGSTVGYGVGLDAEVGGADTGFAYTLMGYPIGVGLRWGDGNVLALRGGIGIDSVAGSVPFAARIPAELTFGVNVGPIRPVLFASTSWVIDSEARSGGSPAFDFADEIAAGLLVRLSRTHRYWTTLSAGGGLAIGAVYRERMGMRSIGFEIGFDLVGAQ